MISIIWNTLILEPMLNSLVILYSTLAFKNFGLAIILFTILVRVLTVPLTKRQLRSTRRMTELQPKLEEIKRRYAKDKARVSQETMRLYKSSGVNPLGCLGPFVIQFPIWIGLYQSIIQLLPTSPEALARLSQHLYSWLPGVETVVPLNSRFLWLDLAVPDPSPFIMPVLVGASMFVQQKMTMMPTADPRTESTNRMMLWMMPFMFAIFTLSFPSGLALYWFVSAVIGIGIQYYTTGWGRLFPARREQAPVPTSQDAAQEGADGNPVKEAASDGNRGDDSQDSGRGGRARAPGARRRTRGGRGRGR